MNLSSAVGKGIVLAVLAAVAGSAMAQKDRGQRDRILESPPTMPWRPLSSLRSDGMRSRYSDSTSYQVNVDGSGQNIIGDAANEPSIVVDPLNPNHISIGWRQFNSVTSNFRQSGNAYSTDGGQTWTNPGLLENNVFRSDPVLVSDSSGIFYYLSLKETFYDDIWRSPTWGSLYTRVADADGGDKQWMTIDTTNSSGHGFMYQHWSTAGNNYGGRQFTRSTDGGQTWMNPINLPNQPIWGVPDVDANGNLFISGSNGGSSFYLLRSSNAKNGAVTPTFDQSTTLSLGGSMPGNVTVNPAGLAGQVWMAIDRSTGPNRGNIYFECCVGSNGSNPCDVKVARSTNGGASFLSPVRINTDPANQTRWHWMGALSVAPNGRVDVTWLDTRADPTNNNSALYRSYSLDGGVTWSANEQISGAFNEHLGYPQQNKMGDYLTTISDNTGCDIAYTATFNGEEDVYFLRVDAPNPPYAVLPASYLVTAGIESGGNLQSLFAADANRLIIIGDSLHPSMQLQVTGNSPYGTASQVDFTYRASSSRLDMVEQVTLWNWTLAGGAGNWDGAATWTRPPTATDSTVTHSITTNASNYINPSTKQVKSRLTWIPASDVAASDGWLGQIDQTVWSVTP